MNFDHLQNSFYIFIADTLSFFKFYQRPNKLPHGTEAEQLEAGDINPEFVLSIGEKKFEYLYVFYAIKFFSDYLLKIF